MYAKKIIKIDSSIILRPGNAEAYLCTPMKLDKSNTNYIVGFEPTAHMRTAHHMILYGCKSPARLEAIYNCGGMAIKGNLLKDFISAVTLVMDYSIS